jgi:hypothetical protein
MENYRIARPIVNNSHTAPSPQPTRPAVIDVIRCKQLLECGCWHFNPSETLHCASDDIYWPSFMVSLLLSCLKRCFSINFANNLIEKTPMSPEAAKYTNVHSSINSNHSNTCVKPYVEVCML